VSTIADIMTRSIATVRRDEVRRLAVSDAGSQVVGIVALADLATRQSAHTDETLREIATPGR
jgi:CBS-domain-containing membrane protein